MPAPDIFVWNEFAGSSRGLLARPVLPNNIDALRGHITSIEYKVYNVTDGGPPDVGTLDPLDVMLTAPSGKGTWTKDDIGYTFNWPASGDLWALPGKKYQIVLTFTCSNLIATLTGKQFIRVYKVTTYNPIP